MISQPRKRILVIDDEEGFGKLLKMNLEHTGKYKVFCESDSIHAVEMVHEVRPDIILLDVVMPGKDGGEIAQDIEDDPALRRVPVIFVTALVDNDESKGLVIKNAEGQQLLGKPFRMSTLCECIDENTRWSVAEGGNGRKTTVAFH